jgi:hypothetical protein
VFLSEKSRKTIISEVEADVRYDFAVQHYVVVFCSKSSELLTQAKLRRKRNRLYNCEDHLSTALLAEVRCTGPR